MRGREQRIAMSGPDKCCICVIHFSFGEARGSENTNKWSKKQGLIRKTSEDALDVMIEVQTVGNVGRLIRIARGIMASGFG